MGLEIPKVSVRLIIEALIIGVPIQSAELLVLEYINIMNISLSITP